MDRRNFLGSLAKSLAGFAAGAFLFKFGKADGPKPSYVEYFPRYKPYKDGQPVLISRSEGEIQYTASHKLFGYETGEWKEVGGRKEASLVVEGGKYTAPHKEFDHETGEWKEVSDQKIYKKMGMSRLLIG